MQRSVHICFGWGDFRAMSLKPMDREPFVSQKAVELFGSPPGISVFPPPITYARSLTAIHPLRTKCGGVVLRVVVCGVILVVSCVVWWCSCCAFVCVTCFSCYRLPLGPLLPLVAAVSE